MGNTSRAAKCLRDWLALNCPLYNPATTRLGLRQRWQFAGARLDVLRFRDRRWQRPALYQFAVGVRAVDRIIGHHRLSDAHGAPLLSDLHRAARHQSHARSGGGELCSGQFDRHSLATLFHRVGVCVMFHTSTKSKTVMARKLSVRQCD
ncbi:MAG: hypothetical protein AAGH57_10845 [Pseudomonadota bacterium]